MVNKTAPELGLSFPVSRKGEQNSTGVRDAPAACHPHRFTEGFTVQVQRTSVKACRTRQRLSRKHSGPVFWPTDAGSQSFLEVPIRAHLRSVFFLHVLKLTSSSSFDKIGITFTRSLFNFNIINCVRLRQVSNCQSGKMSRPETI